METTSYWHALDRGPLGKSSEFSLDPLKLGISHGGQIDEGLKVNIFRGAKTVELAFFGVGKGQRTQAPTPESYGATLLYATGPLGSSISRRKLAQEKNLKLNQYGLWKGKKMIAGKTEREIYNKLGLSYRPPEERGLPR